MSKWKKSGVIDTDSDFSSTDDVLTWFVPSNSAKASSATMPQSSQSAAASLLSSPTPDLDLTTAGNFGTIGDALFMNTQVQSAGTGQFDSFVQIQHNGTEQGYNTDHRPQQFNEASTVNHNHSLLLSNVAIVIGDGSNGTNDGTVYREFLLDANEQNGGGKNLLSLDQLQIFQETAGNLTGFTPGVGFVGAPLQHLVFDLDAGADRWIALNATLSSGSGQSDMRLLIPDALFDPSLPYVVVYSGFGFQGGTWATDGGYEEWGIDTANSPGHGGNAFLNITKSATVPGGTADTAGELITYAITVSNTGSTSLTGITVTDPFVSNLTRGADIVGNNDAVLNAGEIWSYSANHAVTQDEIDNFDFIDNTATADSDQTGPDTASAAVAIDRHPHVTLTKNAAIVGGAVDAAGDVIHYRLTATNDGNVTLTSPLVTDPQFTISTPVDGAPIVNPDAQIFIPVIDVDGLNLGDTDNDGVDEPTDHNGVEDPGETFQYVYPGDTDQNGRHDPGETWVAFNLGDADNDGFRDPGETFVGDTNNNGIEDDGETWQFKNLGDTNNNRLQDNGETWQYLNAGDTNQNGIEDNGETFLYHNIGNTNQNGSEDPGEDFQYYNAGDANQNGIEDNGETFQFIVTNTVTSVDANNDGFNDGDTNLDGKLSVGETWKYTGIYTATQDDIDNRDTNGIPTFDTALTHDNTATLTVNEPASDTASASVPIAQNPHVTLTKNAAVIGGVVDQAGDVIHYRFNVSNDGNMTLTGVDVSDPSVSDLAGVDANNDTFNDGDSNLDGELDIGETWKYTASHTVTQDDIDNRVNGTPTLDANLSRDNTASVTTDQSAQGAQGATDSDSASVPIDQNPSFSIQKAVTDVGGGGSTGQVDSAGDVISYSVTVANTGNMTLTGVSVNDPLLQVPHGTLSAPTESLIANGELDVGETWTYTGSYTAQQSDLDSGGDIENTATADSAQTDPVSASQAVTVVQNPHLTLDKSGTWTDGGSEPNGFADPGEQVNYTITVFNGGNVTLHNVQLDDTVLGPLTTHSETGGSGTNNDDILDVGETWTFNASYAINQSDIDAGNVHNEATASALGPQDQVANDSDDNDAYLPQFAGAHMALDKSGGPLIDPDNDGPTFKDPIQYFFTLVNNGTEALHDLQLDDTLFGMIAFTNDSGDANGLLDPGETWFMGRTYLITEDDIAANEVANDATATGLDPSDVLVTSNTAHWLVAF